MHTEIRTQTDTWEVDICDECGHDVSHHYNNPVEVRYTHDGPVAYIAIGCMVVQKDGGRKIENNPYPRCTCLHSK